MSQLFRFAMAALDDLMSSPSGFEYLRNELLQSEDHELRAAYEYASAERFAMSQGFNKRGGMRLWLFSWPTYECFHAFLNDRELVELFVRFLHAAHRQQALQRVSNRRLKKQLKNSGVEGLASRVTKIITRTLGDDYLFRTECRDHELTVVRWPAEAQALAAEVALQQARKAVLARVVREIERQARIEYKRYSLHKLIDGDEGEASLAAALQTALEDESLIAKWGTYHSQYKVKGILPLSKLQPKLTSLLLNGKWPRFMPTVSLAVKFACHYRGWQQQYPSTAALKQKLVDELKHAITHPTIKRWGSGKCGLNSVGLKVHCLQKTDFPADLVGVLNESFFKAHGASQSVTLPAVGSVEALLEILEILAARTGHQFLENPRFQLQVCSPGRLYKTDAACLGLAYLLGSGHARKFVSVETSHQNATGKRLIIHDAGVVDCQLMWREESEWIPISSTAAAGRTDVLTCYSERDLRNVNLTATLLAHRAYGGAWHALGEELSVELKTILGRYDLSDQLHAPWVNVSAFPHESSIRQADDMVFQRALQHLCRTMLSEGRQRAESTLARGPMRDTWELLSHLHETVRRREW